MPDHKDEDNVTVAFPIEIPVVKLFGQGTMIDDIQINIFVDLQL